VTETAPASDAVVVRSLADGAGAPVRFSSGVDELDRVLGGGFVPGSVLLLAGEPGIGKSTLVLQMLNGTGAAGRRTLLVTGEESLDQVAMRAARLGLSGEALRAAATTSLQGVLAATRSESPAVLVVDSVQTLQNDGLDHPPGSVTQVRESAAALVEVAKLTGTVIVLVGQVTKDGGVAGPKSLEHIVDVVVTLEGDRGGVMRLLRTTKNRFGSCDETGVFLMSESGLEPVSDPSAMFLADRRAGVPGSIVFGGLEGTRPLLVEIQALACMSGLPQPRRVAIGLDARRLLLLTGVLSERAGLPLKSVDLFVAAAGGLAVKEPAADLAVALAIHSAVVDVAGPADVVAVGEIGLGGEVRRVPGIERRLAEAARLGFRGAIVPNGVGEVAGLRMMPVGEVRDALDMRPAVHRTAPSVPVG
jgi:DNA repair protein RadA/Sms